MITRLAEKSIHRMGSLCFRRAKRDARAQTPEAALNLQFSALALGFSTFAATPAILMNGLHGTRLHQRSSSPAI